MSIKRFVEVSFQREGIHRYPAAATDPKLADVSFLGNPHRHIFHFYARVEVEHNDREIEFILLKRELENRYGNIVSVDYKSCEMLAEDLIEYLNAAYGSNREKEVRVFEDNENGAVLVWKGNQ